MRQPVATCAKGGFQEAAEAKPAGRSPSFYVSILFEHPQTDHPFLYPLGCNGEKKHSFPDKTSGVHASDPGYK